MKRFEIKQKFWSRKKYFLLARERRFLASVWTSPFSDLVVMGGDACSRGREFESQRCILRHHFRHLYVVQLNCFFKISKINKWRLGLDEVKWTCIHWIQPVWPYMAKFRQSKKFSVFLKSLICIWHTLKHILTNCVCHWADFQWCKWPKIEK